ncbi:hypothetical protein BDN72DRAFT_752156, partial [Pluteus cervinus]
GDRELGLRKFELSEKEWTVAEELLEQLKILKHATSYFSRGTPNLATVIPAIDTVDEKFTNAIRDEKVNPAIRSAIILAKRTLNKYYSLTDQSSAYRIAMILHPRHKLKYFEQAGWDTEWIAEA